MGAGNARAVRGFVPRKGVAILAIKRATTTEDLKQPDKPAVEGYTTVVGPSGTETTVPDSILESLLDSGYTKK